ncbi:filamentous hemagglutinin N-terminal domain-containing protein [Paraburkholderia sp. Ac-20342]|uniref:hemagglutinin repeat-containing protein n=1 Tax=Paraburkholderia sp. Ac-20342 TaxID=2703889 RepID=UPI001980F589|nr:hemagglutinin repeat-containing protein [Paraburkholderia sp. Ac-20342]MBN3851331.1 filamentous hemagglutinin N-terminal domain-containing protein [Paraburkholderia sp. Ac-20342]
MLVAVAETATATGKEAGQTPVCSHGNPAGYTALFSLRQIAFAALALLGVLPAWSSAQIVPSGANAPNVISTANGLPQVNINRPSGAGVSMNTYSQFDVQKAGAILNNSPVITNTQQAGQINGNPNFGANQAARIIVNQVNSSAASQINGHLEVAGQRAEVVIANGSGISVNGGGFLNTSRAILTTGRPNFAPDGSLTGFNVRGGNITVQGAGLDGSTVDQVDLLARAVQVNAEIYAGKNLNVITGANQIGHDSLAFTPIAGDGPAPDVSIDVSQLGGMYSGRIFLASNEYGVGVSNQGVIAAQAGDLTLQSNGLLSLAGKTSASGNLAATGSDIQNSGTTYAQQNATLSASGMVTNSGTVAAQQNTTVNATSVNSTGTLGAGVNGDDGSVGSGDDLNVTASGQLNATGQNVAGGNASLSGSGVNLAGGRTSANGALVLAANGGDLNLSGATTTAGGTLDARAAGTLTNDNGAMSSGGAQTITAGALSNRNGQIVSGGTLSVQTSGALNNAQGMLEAAGREAIDAGSIDNTAGRITSLNGDGLTVNTAGALVNASGTTANGAQGGVIGSNGGLDVAAGTLSNQGAMSALGDATLTAQTISNDGGSVTAGGSLSAQATGALSNVHGQFSATDTTVSGATIDNTSGQIDGDQVSVSSAGALVNRSGSITQSGTADQTVSAGGALDNTNGTLATNAQNLAISAQALTNDDGAIQHAGTGTLAVTTAGAASNASGQIVTNGTLQANAASLDNTGGTLSAQQAASVSATSGIINRNGGQIYGADGLTVVTQGTLDNTAGSVQSGGNLTASAGSAIENSGGVISANGADGTLTVSGSTLDNTSGSITNAGTGATSATAADSITNTGGVLGGNGDVGVTAQTLTNSGSGQLVAGGAASLNVANRIDNAGGRLYGGTALSVNGPGAALVNDGGTIEGGQDVSLAVASLSNAGGAVRANRDISVSGALAGGGEMTAGHDLTLVLEGDFVNDAASALHADNNLTLGVTGTLTNTAALGAVNALTVSAANIVNAAGADMNSSATTVNATGDIANAGEIEGDAVTTHSASLNNTGAVIGNNVIVNATDVTNAGAQAVIAGASFLGIYAGSSLTNADDALIYSGGNMELARDNARDSTGLLANQTGIITNSAASIQAAGDIDVAARTLANQRTGVQTEAGTPVTTEGPTLTLWTGGIPIDEVASYHSAIYGQWIFSGAGGIGGQVIGKLAKPLVVTLPASQVSSIDAASQTFSLATPLTDTYRLCPTTYCVADPQSRTITNNAVQYYQSLVQNSDGTVTVTFYPDYDPAKNIAPDQVRIDTTLGTDSHDYVELSRTSTTTTATDQLLNPGTAATIQAQGSIRVNADGGTINNDSSTMAAGGDLVRRATGGSVNDTGILLQQTGTQTDVSTFYWHAKTSDSNDTRPDVKDDTVPLPSTTVASLPAITTANQTVQTDAQDITIGSVDRVGQTVTGAGVSGGDATGTHLGSASASGSRPQTLGSAGDGIPGLTLPTNALYTYHTAPDATWLVVTDPRFTSYSKFISSDYMLAALGLNPQAVEKRLGDGLYEEQLVMSQVTQLTGRTFLGPYTSDMDEYTALMDNGVAYAQAFNLSVGVGLSDAQMAQLTTDMVWLVNQTVALPDGTQQTVLVPKLYLAQSSTVDLQDSGALVAGNSVNLNATGDMANSGHVAGDVATTVIGNNVVNRGVIGSGGATTVAAVQDVTNIGGRIGGVDTVVSAGLDIVNQSTTAQAAVGASTSGFYSNASGMAVQSAGTISASDGATLAAGRDVNLDGAAIRSGGDTTIGAGRDINVGTTTLTATQDAGTTDGLNGHHSITTTSVGSTITTGGSLTTVSGNDTTLTGAHVQAGGDAPLVAGGDLTVTAAKDTATYNGQSVGGDLSHHKDSTYDETAQGSSINAGGNATLAVGQAGTGNLAILGSSVTTGGVNGATGGAVILQSTGNITVGAVTETHDADHWSQTNHANALSSEKVTDTSTSHQVASVGSLVSGDSAAASAVHDLNINGSTVAATNDLTLSAGHDLNITTTQDTSQSSTTHEVQASGFGAMSGGGASINYGTREENDTTHDSSVTHNGSLVGSTNGSVTMSAGQDLHITGSEVIAAQNVSGNAGNVIIDAATNTSHHDDSQEMKQSGFTLGLSGSVGDAINSAVSQAQAASSGAGDSRATALHAFAAAGNSAIAVAGMTGGALAGSSPSVGAQLSFGTNQSRSNASEDQTSHIGSTVQAGVTTSFVATGDGTAGSGNITVAGSNVSANDMVLAARNQVNLLNTTDTDTTASTYKSSSANVGVSYGTQGFGVSASMSNAHGDANSDAAMQNNSHVSGANSVTIVSGGDTNIIGSNVNGGTVTANVGGNLNIESVQDTTVSTAHQSSVSGGFSVSQGGGSASFSAQNGHADSNYAQVKEQAGINVGDGGFNINVNGNTDLKGAVIASDADASKNSLTTGTLSFSDIENESHYSATSNGFSVGAGVGSTGKASGPGSVGGSGGIVPMISQNEHGDESATTRSAMGAGTINITDGAKQTQDVAGLSRDTTDTNGTVSKTPDVNALLAQQADLMNAVQAAGQVMAQGIGAYADMKRDASANAVEAAANSNDPQALAAALADYANWREGGDSRAALQEGGGAVIGGLGGGVFGAFGGAAGAAISSKLADQTKAAADAVSDATGSSLIGNISGNILSGLAGGLVGGSAGAAMASGVNLYNQSMDTEAAAKDARLKGIVAQALGSPPDLDSFSVSTLIDQFVGQVKSGAQARMSESPIDLLAQGVANGLNAVVGTGGGKPPAASPGGGGWRTLWLDRQ